MPNPGRRRGRVIGRPRKYRINRGFAPLRHTQLFSNPGFPDQMRVTLKYVDFADFTTGGVPNNATYRGNGAQDPQFAVGGHSPLYWDQIKLIYGRYYVEAVKVNLHIASSGRVKFALWPNIDSVALTNFNTGAEQPRCIVKSANATDIVNMTANYTTKAVLGGRGQKDLDYTGLTGGLPSKQWYIHVLANGIDQSTAFDVEYTIILAYKIIFFDKKLVAGSGGGI